jgi:hypothetical protein
MGRTDRVRRGRPPERGELGSTDILAVVDEDAGEGLADRRSTAAAQQ